MRNNDELLIAAVASLDAFWAGTDAGLSEWLSKQSLIVEAMAAFAGSGRATPTQSSLLSKQNGVGVISIKGPISAEASYFDELFGATSYPAIRNALIEAASADDIHSIMLDVSSPGGAVTGVADTAALIKQIDTGIKPVAAHASGPMASAAYWLGSSARQVTASSTSTVGSIGVIVTHSERSKMLERMGITTTVLREGEYKALGSPFEPLSDKAKADIQSKMSAANKIFVDGVAANRGSTPAVVDATMGQGRTFLGTDAQNVGLTDGTMSFDAAMTAVSKWGADAPPRARTTNSESHMATTALTEQDIAALAAGATGPAKTAEELAAAAALQATADQVAADALAAAQAATAAETQASADAVDPVKLQSQITALAGEKKVADDARIAALVDLKIANDKITALEASVAPLRAVVQKSCLNMQVAMKRAPIECKGDTAALLSEHEQLATAFTSHFPVGGVAATTPPEKSRSDQGNDKMAARNLAAVGL